jgi:aminopeptidase N
MMAFPSLMLATALIGAVPTPPPADSLTGPGVSRALADRRARDLSEIHYALRLDVTARDTAAGQAELRFTRRGAGDLVLDFRGPSFDRVVVNGRPVEPRVVNGHLVVPGASLRRGSNVVSLDFRALIAPAGASIISYDDASDHSRYLYTLLVPADAHQLFPCFDQPDLKARVSLTLVTPPGWRALANGRQLSMDSGVVKTVRFAETEPISTYLVAFAAGPWAVRSAVVGGRPISMYVRASRAREAEADTLIALNARALEWLERYTATPFPFQKYDFLLAPAFPFGGMEHPGAVFYNEESFIYRERPTLAQLLGRQATIYHEVAHQWFGDYATMRWFDDLWLKEGFATYLAAVMQSDLDPAANAWKTFYLRNKPAAYAVDASAGTTPVWQRLANLDQAKSNYGAIVYNKAPGILKQLNYLVGDTAFRDGLRLYLRQHPYGNASWPDLLSAVGTASHRSLDEWGRSYILRAGMPVVTQRLELRGGRIARLTLEQEPARALSGAAPWPMRVQLLLGYADAPAQRITVELEGRRTVVPVAGRRAPDYVFANADDQGYGLVRLDERSVGWLEVHVGEVEDPFLRGMLWGALWDQVRDARLDPARFIRAALRALPRERDEQLAPVLIGRVSRAASTYLSPAAHSALLPALEAALRAGAADGSRPYGVRKANLDAYVALAASSGALASLDSLLDVAEVAGAPLRAPTRWAIVTTLVARRAPSADTRLELETRRDSTSEGRRRAFVARAARPDSATKASYWSRYFADRSLNEEWVTASLRAFNDPEQEALTRAYLVPALDSLPWIQRNRRIFFLGSWIGAFIEGQRSREGLVEVDGMLAANPSLPRDLREKILQSRDELERTVAIRAAFPSR